MVGDVDLQLVDLMHLMLDVPWGTNLLRESLDKFKLIQDRLLTAQNRKNMQIERFLIWYSWLESDYNKGSPMKGVMRFVDKVKLSPCYIGTFEIIDCIG